MRMMGRMIIETIITPTIIDITITVELLLLIL